MNSADTQAKLPKGFSYYILTQSLGAFNDNYFKMLLQILILQVIAYSEGVKLLSIASFAFTIPFVLFAPWSGYLADRFSKTKIMFWAKFGEVILMSLGLIGFYFYNVYFLTGVLFLMATQSTFFSPAKTGIIPEFCHSKSITKANGWLEMTTFLSIILGTVAPGFILYLSEYSFKPAIKICIGIALIGLFLAKKIPYVKPANTVRKFPLNPFSQMIKDLIYLKKDKGLFLASLAMSFFWFVGLIFQLNILVYGKDTLGLTDPSQTMSLALLPAFVGLGIALGSPLASRWSGKKVEIGLIPFGGLGLTICSFLFYFTQSSYLATAICLLFAGVFGGLYIVPLYAYLQYYADDQSKGRIMAISGMVSGFFLILGSGFYHLVAVTLELNPTQIFFIMAVIILLVIIYICTIVPDYLIRFITWLITHTLYKIKIKGEENIPLEGPAILTPNHIAYIDPFLIGACIQNFIIFIMYKKFYDIFFIKPILKIMKVIPIAPYEGRESVTQSLNLAHGHLKDKDLICIFPEGQITRHGEINEFRKGIESIADGIDCPITPVYLENVWGSIFSFKGDKAVFKFPKKIPYPVTIHFGKPVPSTTSADELELIIREMEKDVLGEHS
jgi:acyl-[acyl-carrier-protein]-phospholipid O-acyltransferase/long-chain-fatty-acid--[acyl-carrier-protein] ligase